MKLIVLLLTVLCLHVSAQTHSQKLTISAKDMPLEKVFLIIERQTGCFFFYDIALLKGRSVTLDVKDAGFEDVLIQCLKDQPLDFKIFENCVAIIKQRPRIKQTLNRLDEPQVKRNYVATVRLDTNNVIKVKAKEIQKQPVTNPILAIVTRVRGQAVWQIIGLAGMLMILWFYTNTCAAALGWRAAFAKILFGLNRKLLGELFMLFLTYLPIDVYIMGNPGVELTSYLFTIAEIILISKRGMKAWTCPSPVVMDLAICFSLCVPG